MANYNVYRGATSGNYDPTPIAQPTGTTYTDNTVVNDNTYYYVVSAVYTSPDGESEYTNEISATPNNEPVELIYDNDVTTGSYRWNGYTMATHLSPEAPCQIMKLKFWTSGTGDFNAEVYEWLGSQPGTTTLNTTTVTCVDELWMEVDISGDNVSVISDFVVGFGSINETAHIGYDGGLNNGRSWDFDSGASTWESWTEAYLIRAIVVYETGIEEELGAPIVETYKLKQNYPNPFNPSTAISFDLPTDTHTTLNIYNIKGQLVKTLVNDEFKAGSYTIQWDGKDNEDEIIGSGIYFYKLEAGDYTETRSMVMLK